MVASARLAYLARRGAEYRVRTGPVSVDLAAVRGRKRAMVDGARENYASRLAQDGLDLIEGEARFTGPKTVEVARTDGGTRQLASAMANAIFAHPLLAEGLDTLFELVDA
jgi:pyruvate/2-oxoglutarate dehydrogenase complex dihydrolipoamide dehydrogenase (E3) component